MRIKKIFVSLPMGKLHEDEIRRKQEKLLELAGEYLHEPVMLIENFITDSKYDPLECLGEGIKRMASADYVLFADGFMKASGCKIELACAVKYGKQILLEDKNKIEEVI